MSEINKAHLSVTIPRTRSTGENIGERQPSTDSIRHGGPAALLAKKSFLDAVGSRPSVRFDPSISSSEASRLASVRPSQGQFNWSQLAQKLKEKTATEKKRKESKTTHGKGKNLVKAAHFGPPKLRLKFALFFRRLHCLFSGNMFYRHPYRIITFFEILFPPFFTLIIFLAFTSGVSWRKTYDDKANSEANRPIFKSMGENELKMGFNREFGDHIGRFLLIFTPDNNFTRMVIRSAVCDLKTCHQNRLSSRDHSGFGTIGVDTHAELIENCLLHRRDQKQHKFPVGVTFIYNPGEISNITKLPNNLKFSISTFNPTIAATSVSHPYVDPPRSEKWRAPYIQSGFLGLQVAIENAYKKTVSKFLTLHYMEDLDANISGTHNLDDPIEMKKSVEQVKMFIRNANEFPSRKLKMVYFPNFYNANMRRLIKLVICVVIVVAYTSLSYFIVKQVVVEHESGIKDLLKMHSLPTYVHWIVLACHALLFRTITAALVTSTFFIDFSRESIFQKSNAFVIFAFIWLHLMSHTSFNFLLATTLTSVPFSGVYSVCVCFLTYFVPLSLWRAGLVGPIANLVLCCLFPNWTLVNGISQIVEFESDGQGVDWDNLVDFRSKTKKGLSFTMCILILLGGMIGFFILAMLEDLGRQKKLSNALKWYHVMERCRRAKRIKKLHDSIPKNDEEAVEAEVYDKPLIFEDLLPSQKCIVKVRNLSKVYGKHKLILDDISLNFAAGEITVILGHTSCGKSSLLLCLAGMVRPTLGYATINGYNVITQTAKARQFMGLCPQELIVFNLLTVNDHLVLCFRLRGLTLQEANRQAGELLNLLRLFDVRHRKPNYLTNNEKRKLVIAMCLVDTPNVILLDEPTLGMDSLARREIWDILKNLKKEGHTIILSTNMMDEAEYLADRIALLAHGKLVCFGTPRYLKTHYDTGYVIRIVPEPFKFKLDSVNILAEKHFGQKLTESTKKAMTDQFNVLLELPKSKIAIFADLFDDIEDKKEELGISSYDIQQISLCDIFIKICESVNAEDNAPDVYLRKNSGAEWTSNLAEHIPSIPSEENFKPKIWHHMWALFHKRWICTMNKHNMVFWEYVIPLLMILATAWNSGVFIATMPTSVARTFQLTDFPLARVYTKIAAETKPSKEWISWANAADLILGNRSEKLLPQERIMKRIRDDLSVDSHDPRFTLEKRMIALELTNSKGGNAKNDLIGYFTSGSLHSPPLIMNIMANIILRGLPSNELNETYRISVLNSPLPMFMDTPFDAPCDVSCAVFATIVSFSCCLFLAALIPFPLEERRNGMKQLQLMTGVHPATYWITEYIFDVIISIILTVTIVIIFTVDIRNSYDDPGVQFAILLVIAGYLCWAGLPWVYYLSTLVPDKLGGYTFAVWIHILTGLLPTIILEVFLYSKKGISIARWIFHLFPPYTFTMALFSWFHVVSVDRTCREIPKLISEICTISKQHNDMFIRDLELQEVYKFVLANDINLGKCCPRICKPMKSCYKFPNLLSFQLESSRRSGLLGDLITLGVQGLCYWILLIVSEKRIVERLLQSIVFKFMASQERRRQGQLKAQLQPDIRLEKDRVSSIISKGHIPDQTALVCQDLTKSYATQMVINNVNIEVKKGECISLLGGGGSGKTSIMQMLSGQIIPTRGTVYIGNTNLHHHRKKYLSSIGYCPQTNCLFDGFTGIQMLEMMGRLKGVPGNLLTIHIKKWLQILGLEEVGKDKCILYSPSMKRRLCGAMALIGGNPVILLDEPTTGVDPLARQRFWAVIKHLTMKGHAVIFTSYNVQECTALSTRILVLSEGNVQCVGTPDELQQRFSKGFTLLLRLRYDALTPMEIVSSSIGRVTELKMYVEKKFKHVTLRDEQDNLLLYFLRDTKLTWGDAFRKAEEIKSEYGQILEKYFISQASLDDIFILLTNKYRELDKPRRMDPTGEVSSVDAEKAAIKAATKALSK